MPKVPRDLSGKELADLLAKFGFHITRQTGSHIRLTSTFTAKEHHITIPNHTPLKIGTLNAIVKDVAAYLNLDRSVFLQKLLNH
jgi:predicted RNA binding protein YcfA (HicA-like mRNA interferase family)